MEQVNHAEALREIAEILKKTKVNCTRCKNG